MENEEFVKKVYWSSVEGPNRRRRPLGRWEDKMKEYMCERGVRGIGLEWARRECWIGSGVVWEDRGGTWGGDDGMGILRDVRGVVFARKGDGREEVGVLGKCRYWCSVGGRQKAGMRGSSGWVYYGLGVVWYSEWEPEEEEVLGRRQYWCGVVGRKRRNREYG